tara:strand:+ start:313 stop:714 length:402 start_codon:yes stop_codon:yes gene_type:complete
MPNYVPDSSGYDIISGSGPDKQTVGALPDNAYDRTVSDIGTGSFFKTPNAVVITQTPSKPIGFHFGDSASFAALSAADKIAKSTYVEFGTPTAGTVLNIHPIAYSASLADHNAGTGTFKVALIYKSGLSTGGF